MSTKVISKKITSVQVVDKASDVAYATKSASEQVSPIQHMTERYERPDILEGTTYKVKPPVSDHAIYVTINDVILNPGTAHEERRPFEIFINSKDMEHYQWISSLTLIISAVFRKGGDCIFLVDELRSVFDPKGGYMKAGGRWMPSLVAEIGDILERHLIKIGVIKQDRDVSQKMAPVELPGSTETVEDTSVRSTGIKGMLCKSCSNMAVVKLDGCLTCMSCGDSKCG